MYRHTILIFIILSTLITCNSCAIASPTIIDATNDLYIDSFLMMELSHSNYEGAEGNSGCKAILRFEEELTHDELAYIESTGIHLEKRGTQVIHVGPVYSVTVDDLESVYELANIGLVQATSGSKQFYTSLTTSVDAINAPLVWSTIKKGDDFINGSGVRVAIIDTGISLIHPSFWRASTEPLDVIEDTGQYYVDLNGNQIAESDEGPIRGTFEPQSYSNFDYSTNYLYIDANNDGDFDFEQGERWLGGYDENSDGMINLPDEDVSVLGESKVVLLYNQESGLVYERGVNLTTQGYEVTDYHGHGTHVASIIAAGQPEFTSMTGVAPGADLIIIRSPLESSDIIDGIHFAIINDAEVINMSFSSYLGFLDGNDPEDIAVTEAFRRYGVISTLAAGNLGGSRGSAKHSRFMVTGNGMTNVSFQVSSLPQYSFLNILWRSDDQDEHVILTPPGGQPIDLGAFSELDRASILENEDIEVYVFKDVSNRGYCRIILQRAISEHFWNNGEWTLSISNPAGDDVWVDAYAWDNDWTTRKIVFTSHGDSSRVVSSPATADFGIAVAAYDEGSQSILGSSSRGPRIDGLEKPEIAAPGSSILAANRLTSLSSLWTTRTGTSMACPHVAGAVALIKQAADETNGWTSLSALFEGAGSRLNHQSPPDTYGGYGLCDCLWSVRHLIDLSFEPTITLDSWSSLDILITDPSEEIDGSLDIRSVREYQETELLGIAITFDDKPDFYGTNILSIRWNTDSNLNTGPNGADMIINITEGEASPFQWSDSSYSDSMITVDWWNDSSSVFVSIEKPEPGLRGSISVATSNVTMTMIDETQYADLENQWRPIIDSIIVSSDETEYDIDIQLSDRDDLAESLSVNWSVVDGGFNELVSGSATGAMVNVNIDLTEIDSSNLVSIFLEISDSHEFLSLPLLSLSSGIGVNFSFVDAYLNQTTVRVGFMINERVSGKITAIGYSMISEVYISFKSEFGYSLNFTLLGSNGEYQININPSGFSAGEYEVFAVAETNLGARYELHFANLEIIEDNTILILGGSAVVVVVIAIFLVPRLINRTRKE
jgi:subtilisin family serine protease